MYGKILKDKSLADIFTFSKSINTCFIAPTPVSSAAPKVSEAAKILTTVPPPSSGGTLKLKDYLPYMKNRSLARPPVAPQGEYFANLINVKFQGISEVLT